MIHPSFLMKITYDLSFFVYPRENPERTTTWIVDFSHFIFHAHKWCCSTYVCDDVYFHVILYCQNWAGEGGIPHARSTERNLRQNFGKTCNKIQLEKQQKMHETCFWIKIECKNNLMVTCYFWVYLRGSWHSKVFAPSPLAPLFTSFNSVLFFGVSSQHGCLDKCARRIGVAIVRGRCASQLGLGTRRHRRDCGQATQEKQGSLQNWFGGH